MLIAAYITGSFLVAGVGAWYLLRGKHEAFGRRTVSLGLAFATMAVAVKFLSATSFTGQCSSISRPRCRLPKASGKKIPHRPHPITGSSFPIRRISAIASRSAPLLGSIWLTHSLKGRVEGLKNTPRDRQPMMGMVFYGFRDVRPCHSYVPS